MYQNQEYPFPCLCCHPHSYIRMVQNLIERCLLLGMDRDRCVKALAIHARIPPLVTLTVWRELLKENKDFFQVYFNNISSRPFLSRHYQRESRFGRRKQWK
ncbi:PREDICTED: uncharacterized protein LOC109210055 [Nicotiana attenuata]|uniref:uncharacterized protein LOC109210055 n=1 Tax=Nicotiana attenuata TaxID=49451 RepID=UPI0009046C38|nr:PREDICTED: uncharacterized protein LOC109210055 [Nicotiana attenuata]